MFVKTHTDEKKEDIQQGVYGKHDSLILDFGPVQEVDSSLEWVSWCGKAVKSTDSPHTHQAQAASAIGALTYIR